MDDQGAPGEPMQGGLHRCWVWTSGCLHTTCVASSHRASTLLPTPPLHSRSSSRRVY